ncbi:dihydropteroate synthase [Tropicimonas sp.]|uniref:dihydropteroate synthase n=1 Tax=Tropicimonas sp. TaxID=2067044 RepID=UPI003A86EECE
MSPPMPATYYRPIPESDVALGRAGLSLAGTRLRFERVEVLSRGQLPRVVPADTVPAEILARMTEPRAAITGVSLGRPRLMGILNVTPDSFSDGGVFDGPDAAVAAALRMVEDVDILDIGGESTRPGAADVPAPAEIARTAPVIAALSRAGVPVPVSIDTRKAAVARAAFDAGATIVNDVSGLGYDPDLAPLVAATGAPVCIMHSIATPATMQDDPRYDDVLLDVFDFLEQRIALAESCGIPRARIVVDPGIGFGKTVAHNLALLARVSLFHTLGCAILLGVSRKRFIGGIGGAAEPRSRGPGSIAVALAAMAQGVQILRIHDTSETAQALKLYLAATTGKAPGETI